MMCIFIIGQTATTAQDSLHKPTAHTPEIIILLTDETQPAPAAPHTRLEDDMAALRIPALQASVAHQTKNATPRSRTKQQQKQETSIPAGSKKEKHAAQHHNASPDSHAQEEHARETAQT